MNATRISHRTRSGGFTLVELLVVIGLMAMMGTVSISGYFAAQRGMKTRGALQDTISFIRQAQQASLIDNTPTAVLFLNRYAGNKDDDADVYGTAIAVKMAGRISMIAKSGYSVSGTKPGAMLVDEFADWNASFPHDASKSSDKRGLRLYRMTDIERRASSGLEGVSSVMNNWVGYVPMSPTETYEYMIETDTTTQQWCQNFKKTAADNVKDGASDYSNGNDYRWGLGFLQGAKNSLASSNWRVGDAYGTEIGSFDLPHGFIFGSKLPDKNGALSSAQQACVVFLPSKANSKGRVPMGKTISVYGVGIGGTAGSVEKIGDVADKDLEDQK